MCLTVDLFAFAGLIESVLFGQAHVAVFAKIDDDFGIPESAVHMTRWMIVGVCGESDSVETD
jgi:hypothetical protein